MYSRVIALSELHAAVVCAAPEQMDLLFLAETYSSGELGTSWQEAHSEKINASAPSKGGEVGPERATGHR